MFGEDTIGMFSPPSLRAWEQRVLSHVELTPCFGICNAEGQLFPPGYFQSVFQVLLSQMVRVVSDSVRGWS